AGPSRSVVGIPDLLSETILASREPRHRNSLILTPWSGGGHPFGPPIGVFEGRAIGPIPLTPALSPEGRGGHIRLSPLWGEGGGEGDSQRINLLSRPGPCGSAGARPRPGRPAGPPGWRARGRSG